MDSYEEHTTITVQEAANVLRVHPITIRRLLEKGELQGFKVGRQWRIHRNSFEEYMRGNQSGKVETVMCAA